LSDGDIAEAAGGFNIAQMRLLYSGRQGAHEFAHALWDAAMNEFGAPLPRHKPECGATAGNAQDAGARLKRKALPFLLSQIFREEDEDDVGPNVGLSKIGEKRADCENEDEEGEERAEDEGGQKPPHQGGARPFHAALSM
jgi:hypothetical protein